MKKRMLAVLVLGSALAGCAGHDGPGGDRSVSWYAKHQKVMKEELHWCSNQSINKQMKSAGCEQANKAKVNAELQSIE